MYFTKQTANMYKIAEEKCAKKRQKDRRKRLQEKGEKRKKKMIGGRN